MIKKAAALANRELKLVDAKRAGAIAKAADEVIAGKWNGQLWSMSTRQALAYRFT